MIYIAREASDEQVLDIVKEWIALLAYEDYEGAFAAIELAARWTPHFIRSDIKAYRSAELYPGVEEFKVTDWQTAQGGNPDPQRKVTRYVQNSSGLAGAIAYDLPLNGRWSTLTADFVFWENDNLDKGYILELEDIGFGHPAETQT